MRKSTLLIKVLVVIASVVFVSNTVLGFQITLDCFEPGIEAREGRHNVRGVALSPDEERLYAAHWQSGTVQVQDPIGIYTTECPIYTDEQLLVGGCAGGVIVSDDGCCVYACSRSDFSSWTSTPASLSSSLADIAETTSCLASLTGTSIFGLPQAFWSCS